MSAVSLRTKAIALIVPVVIGVVLVSGLASAYSSRAALLRVATRLVAFKTEQVRDFAYSQWQVLDELGYADDPRYRRAGEAAIQSYATALVRSPTERVFAIDENGNIGLATTLLEPTEAEVTALLEATRTEGWFEGTLNGTSIVGESFAFEPLGWRVLVTEASDSFYRDIRRITVHHSAILFGGISFMLVALLVFLRQTIVPVERLTSAMQEISASLTFTGRVAADSDDEIGALANEFNTMVATVQVSHEHLRAAAARERDARVAAAAREEETLRVLGAATEFRDLETGAHIARVGMISELLARLHGEDDAYQELILKASPLHDVGKIGISDRILLKPGPLTKKEYETIKEHTSIGWRILSASESIYLRAGAEIALTHHEWWDGNGYPAATAGEDIPLSGRIVGIADVYDALRSDRPYKAAQPHEEALELILAGRGTQFDPGLVDLFVTHEHDVRLIYERATGLSDRE